MSEIPDPIETSQEDNEGFVHDRAQDDLLFELIAKFNDLVLYLDSISERL